jgi:hypothetical protein
MVWASYDLRADKEVVLAAVKNDGSAICILLVAKDNIYALSCNMIRIFLWQPDIHYNLPLPHYEATRNLSYR